MYKLLNLIPTGIITLSTILLAISLPLFEKKIKDLKKKITESDDKIETEKFNILNDAIQKSKAASVHGSKYILMELKSKHQSIFDEGLKGILINNLNALLRGKISSKELSAKDDKELIKLILTNTQKRKEEINRTVDDNKKLKKKLDATESSRFKIYLLIVILQSLGLILNQLISFL